MPLAKSDSSPASSHPRALRIVSMLTACAVFPLIFVGAGVTSKDAGMAFPDWPTSDGHYVNPPNWTQQDDTLWEHGHRLIGWTVGMCAIASVVLAWPRGGWQRRLAVCTLGAIITQGVLGGLRVQEISTGLAMVHGIFGQLCFCLACGTALVCSRRWGSYGSDQPSGPAQLVAVTVLRRLCVVGATVVFVQLVMGAAYRHFGSNVFLITHILWAIVVSFLVGWIAMWIIGQLSAKHLLGMLGRILGALMACQLLAGAFAFVVVSMNAVTAPSVRWLVPTLHVAIGALLLVVCLLVTMCTYHMLEDARRRQPSTEGIAVTST